MPARSRRLAFIAALSIPFLFAQTFAQVCPGSAGCLDASFNGNGKQLIVMAGNGSTSQRDAVLQSDGKVVSLVDNSTTRATMIRLNTDGSFDTSFAGDGIVETDWHHPNGFAYGLAIQLVQGIDGVEERLVIAGSWRITVGRKTYTYLRVERYLPNGTLDTTFANNGVALHNKPYALAVAVQPGDQKILTVGDLEGMTRFNADGTVDTTFGGNGDGTTGAGQSGWSIKALADGKILVGGSYSSGSSMLMAAMKLNANGSVDTSFGTSGRTTINFHGSGSASRAFRIDLDPFGNIILGGFSRPKNSDNNDFAAARLTPSGQLDTTFNGNGKVLHDWAGLSDSSRSVAALSDGSVVITGSAQVATDVRDFGAVRFNYYGQLDMTFGSGGRTSADFGGNSEYSHSVRIWNDPSCSCEKIVMAGSSNTGAAFARFWANAAPQSPAP